MVDILYRIRVGNYRIVYAIFDAELVVLVCKIALRSEATYKDIRTLHRLAKEALGAA